MLFNTSFASQFKNTVNIMSYVQNLVLYAVLAFVFSVTAVVFPKFTELYAKNDMEGFKTGLIKILRSVLYILIPITAGFIAVRYQLIGLLLNWGKIGEKDVALAAGMMALYAMGVAGIGIKEVVDRAFYSRKDTVRPTINGVIMMVVNISASLILACFIGVYGIPLAYSISSLTGAFILLYLLRNRMGALGLKKMMRFVLKVVAASGVMLLTVLAVNRLLQGYSFGASILDRGVKLFVPAVIGAVIYYMLTMMLKVEEASEAFDKVRNVFARR